MNIKPLLLIITLFSVESLASDKISSNIDNIPENIKQLLHPKNNAAYKNFCLTMQDDEIDSFKKNIGSLLSNSVSDSYSASALIELYETNELKANKILSKKQIAIKTIASEIGEDVTGNAYIKANGKNQFKSIILGVNKHDERILDLKKGDRIDLVCDGAKYIVHTPVLSNCVFRDQYAMEHVKDVVDCTLLTVSKNSYIPMTLYKAMESKIEEVCLRDKNKCMDSVLKETNKNNFSFSDSLINAIQESAIENKIKITKTETEELVSNLLNK